MWLTHGDVVVLVGNGNGHGLLLSPTTGQAVTGFAAENFALGADDAMLGGMAVGNGEGADPAMAQEKPAKRRRKTKAEKAAEEDAAVDAAAKVAEMAQGFMHISAALEKVQMLMGDCAVVFRKVAGKRMTASWHTIA